MLKMVIGCLMLVIPLVFIFIKAIKDIGFKNTLLIAFGSALISIWFFTGLYLITR